MKEKTKSKKKEILTPDITSVRQFPYWNATDKFEITGQEFLELKNYFDRFNFPIQAINQIFSRELDKDNIKIKYLDKNNNEFTREEVTNYIASMTADKHVQESVTNPE